MIFIKKTKTKTKQENILCHKSPAKILNYFRFIYHFLPPVGIIPLHISSGCSNKLLFLHLALSKWHLKKKSDILLSCYTNKRKTNIFEILF